MVFQLYEVLFCFSSFFAVRRHNLQIAGWQEGESVYYLIRFVSLILKNDIYYLLPYFTRTLCIKTVIFVTNDKTLGLSGEFRSTKKIQDVVRIH